MDQNIFERSLEIDDDIIEEDVMKLTFPRPVSLEDEDLSIPPSDGDQYLKRVIDEAKNCQEIVIADRSNIPSQTRYEVHEEQVLECCQELRPSKDWQLETISDFSKIRLKMEKLRKKLSKEKVLTELNKSLPEKDNESAWLKICSQKRPDEDSANPSTKLCLSMSQGKIWKVLSYFSDWLTDRAVNVKDGCRWIYCLLACLMLPIDSDIHFILREIARALINYRAKLESSESDELHDINLIICIIGRYFNQIDLADPLV